MNMTLSRFYCPGEMSPGQVVALPANAAHHAARVLRLTAGDEVMVFNGTGGEFSARIAEVRKHHVSVAIDQHHEIERETVLNITLVQSLCANEKMDFVVQKAVELGVRQIQPVSSQRSLVKLSGERAQKRMAHWQQIAVAACEQCGRNRLPPVLPLLTLAEWLSLAKNSPDKNARRFLLSPDAQLSLRDLPTPPANASITLLIGPEGGFAAEEESLAQTAGLMPLRLGPRILRVEGAAIAALGAIYGAWGEF